MAIEKIGQKGDDVHYVNDTTEGNGYGKHLTAKVVKIVTPETEAANLVAFFESPDQHPAGSDPHMHILKMNKVRDSGTTQAPGTWHYREECVNGE